MDYQSSGVDIDAGNEVVRRIKSLAKGTFTPGVLSEIGSFGGLFSLASLGVPDAVLVASADGVGTKLKLAFDSGVHDTVGDDLVNHCVNDILVQGARAAVLPRLLRHRQAVAGRGGRHRRRHGPRLPRQRLRPARRRDRRDAGLLPADGEYDLAGFIVGAVRRDRMIDGKTIAPGDTIVGAAVERPAHQRLLPGAEDRVRPPRTDGVLAGRGAGHDGGAALLTPHRSYLSIIRPLLGAGILKGLAHITGGGMTDNLPRVLPDETSAEIDRRGWTVPPLFAWLVAAGGVPREDAWRTFNMGMGLLAIVAPGDAERLLASLHAAGEPGAAVVGRIVRGDRTVRYLDA